MERTSKDTIAWYAKRLRGPAIIFCCLDRSCLRSTGQRSPRSTFSIIKWTTLEEEIEKSSRVDAQSTNGERLLRNLILFRATASLGARGREPIARLPKLLKSDPLLALIATEEITRRKKCLHRGRAQASKSAMRR